MRNHFLRAKGVITTGGGTTTTLQKSWIFNTSTGGTGSDWQHYDAVITGSSSQGFAVTPATASGYTYTDITSTINNNRLNWATSTASGNTGCADGIGNAYKLTADGGSGTLATVGDAQISQTSNTYFFYLESSSGGAQGNCYVARSPEYTFSGGEYIRIIHALAGGSGGNFLMDEDDSLYIGIAGTGSASGGTGSDLTTAFVEISNRTFHSAAYMGNSSDYDGPYDVAQVQTNFVGTGRIYLGFKINLSVLPFLSDITVAGVQLIGTSGTSGTSSYNGTSGIVSTNIVLDLNATNSSSYGGSGTTWTDISGNGNNGTLVNGVTYNSGDGGHLIFDGTNDKVTLPAGSDFAYGTDDFTIEMWFNVTGTSPQTYGEVLFGQTASGTNYLLLNSSHGINPNIIKKPLFTHSGTNIQTSTAYTEGTWHHIVFTRNGTTGTVYLDNSLVGSESVTQDYNNTTYVPTIAAYTQTNSYNFDGKISQVRIYKGKGFSASDVAQNYNATKSNYLITTDLVLHLDASNSSSYSGSGTTWTDLSGQGNNATLVNGVTYNSGNGGYFIFDGTNDAATISAGSDFAYGTGDFTVETWFNVTGTSPAAWGEILYAQQGPSHNYFLVVSSEFNPVQKKPGFIFGTGGSGTKTLSSTTYTEGTWHHLVITRNGTTVTIYLDNSSVGTVTCSQDFDNTTYVPTIGSNSQQSFGHFDGKIAQLRIYKGKGFSANDVTTNYNLTKANYI